MSENKHYGRQVFLSLFLTVFVLLALIYVASRYLLPLYTVNQNQIYTVLVRLFPLLIGLVMIEIGVLVARRRDEDFADEIDKLPPNAYDKPFYTLPGDDPAHVHHDEMAFSQPKVNQKENEILSSIHEEAIERTEPVSIQKVTESVVKPLSFSEPVVEQIEELQHVKEEETATYTNDFSTILSLELQNSLDMDYDFTLVLIDVTQGPAEHIANKLMMLSGELAYSFVLDDGKIAMVLPFYNADEARSFTLSIIESCKKEFSGSSLQIGFASRNGRVLDSELLLHEAEAACQTQN
ncbi:MAG: hypothetical protein WC136_05845 [Sphaerochaeta sp.]|nr:hypothetical protein [Sphaerochaeta sp.]